MGKPRSHLLDVYDCWLHVATDRRQFAQFRRKYGKTKIEPAPPGEFGCTNRFRVQPADGISVNHFLVFLDVAAHKGNSRDLLNTTVHEATHAAAQILDSTAAEYDGGSEPLAWLVAWVAGWLWEAVG